MLFLEFTELMNVLRAVKSKRRLSWSGHNIFISQDVSNATNAHRKEFLALRPQMRHHNIQYGILHPCLCKITHDGRSRTFDDPEKSKSCLNSISSRSMDTDSLYIAGIPNYAFVILLFH